MLPHFRIIFFNSTHLQKNYQLLSLVEYRIINVKALPEHAGNHEVHGLEQQLAQALLPLPHLLHVAAEQNRV